ncbi:Ig-like domain repeat protein [Actinospica durhamensis]|uniref:Ig-like domain repeat protein n=1 Tax=Actinospica durhamensis TaxID=1508375 RepID=A0A941EVJ0_9ACTN|nr:Ig-like domain repeat protein [Actinospica durhamensis]MBR7838937.1 Ig-like domain repeat protein [Actinospica durhamensis]
MRILSLARSRPPAAALVGAVVLALGALSPGVAHADPGADGLPQAADVGAYFDVADASARPGLAVGPDGNVWTVGAQEIEALDPSSGEIAKRYSIGYTPFELISGPDSSMWFSLQMTGGNGTVSEIGRIDMSGNVTEYPLPAGDGGLISGIAADSAGDIWFATASAQSANGLGYVGYLAPDGSITQFPMPVAYIYANFANSITLGPDGNMWFIGQFGAPGPVEVASVTPAGVITTYPVSYPSSGGPLAITTGADGKLWFSYGATIGGNYTSLIGTLDPLTGAQSTLVLPLAISQVSGLVLGTDGIIYAAGAPNSGSGVEVVGVAPDDQYALFSEPYTLTSYGIAADPDGNLWLSDGGVFAQVTLGKPYSAKMSITADANPAYFGQPGNLVMTLTPDQPGAPTPTGTVSLTMAFGGYSYVGSATVVNGVADFPIADLPLNYATGQDPIDAVYSGDANYGPQAAGQLTVVVYRAQTTLSLTTTVNPSAFGQDVQAVATLTAQGGGEPASGSTDVVFTVDGVNQDVVIGDNGTATLDLPDLSSGTHTIGASFPGANGYAPSTATSLTQTVGQAAAPTVSLSSSRPTAEYGQQVTVVAVVAAPSGAPTPTGSVTFTVNGTQTTVSVDGSGSAALQLPSLNAGTYPITASYSGDANYPAADAPAPLTQTVTPSISSLLLSSPDNPSHLGQDVELDATVVGEPGGPIPDGSVTVMVGAFTQTVALNQYGIATFTLPGADLPVDEDLISASYTSSSGNFDPATATFTQTVFQAPTPTVTLSTSAATSAFDQPATVTATVSTTAPGFTPTGTIVFSVNGPDNAQATVPLDANGAAGYTLPAGLDPGSYTVSATYSGGGNYSGGEQSATLGETVTQAPTTTALAATASQVNQGQSVTFTSVSTETATGQPVNGGQVQFSVNGTATETVTVDGTGTAAFTTTTLPVGTDRVTATYLGDTDEASGTAASATVTVAANALTLSSSANPAVTGQKATFTAQVAPATPGGATPTGTVTFTVDGTAEAPVALHLGTATYKASFTTPGPHTVTAAYSGNAGNPAATSAPFTETVDPAGTTVALTTTGSADPSVTGQAVTFSAQATATAPGTGIPSGTVTFTVDGIAQTPVTLTAAGKATLRLTTLTVGVHTVTAAYSGAAGYTASTSPALQQTVNQASTTVTLTSSVNPSAPTQAVTFTVKVTAVAPGTGVPTGTVVLTIDGVAEPAITVVNGLAKVTFSGLTAGTHTITAAYSGSAAYAAGTSGTLSQTVS